MPTTAKSTKPTAAKEMKPKVAKTSSHPPYLEMIKEALLALNEKGGSSPYAIAKYMEEKHKYVLPANFRKILGLQLKNSTAKGKLIKIKASFKLSDAVKKGNPKPTPAAKKRAAVAKKPKAAAKATAATVGTKRKVAPKKTESVKKVAPKKATAAKPKQPKSIKSPAVMAISSTIRTTGKRLYQFLSQYVSVANTLALYLQIDRIKSSFCAAS